MNFAWILATGLAILLQDNKEQEGLAERVGKLEKQMEEEKKKTPWDPSKMLSFASEDGNFTAKVGGRLYANYRHVFDRGSAVPSPNSFFVDTARAQLDFTFFKDFSVRVESEAQTSSTSGSFRMKDVYLGWNAVPDYLTIQLGQMKEPISQEETCSSRFIDFGERSILNRIVPGHDTGLLFKGSLFDKVLDWNLGIFNSAFSRDGGRNALDFGDEKDVAWRFFVTPFKNSENSLFHQLRVGFDGSFGKREGQPTSDITSGDLGGVTLSDLTPSPAAGVDRQTRLDFSLSWIYGPFSLRAEYLLVKTDLSSDRSFDMNAFYVQATFLLTGEAKPLENRVKPAHNLSLSEGTWGAFEVAARIALLDTKDAVEAGLATAGSNQKTTEFTLGLNWWWTPNVALRLNWEHLRFDEDLPNVHTDGAGDNENIITVRWQIDF